MDTVIIIVSLLLAINILAVLALTGFVHILGTKLQDTHEYLTKINRAVAECDREILASYTGVIDKLETLNIVPQLIAPPTPRVRAGNARSASELRDQLERMEPSAK